MLRWLTNKDINFGILSFRGDNRLIFPIRCHLYLENMMLLPSNMKEMIEDDFDNAKKFGPWLKLCWSYVLCMYHCMFPSEMVFSSGFDSFWCFQISLVADFSVLYYIWILVWFGCTITFDAFFPSYYIWIHSLFHLELMGKIDFNYSRRWHQQFPFSNRDLLSLLIFVIENNTFHGFF